MSTIERNAPHLKPVLRIYGNAVPKVGAVGGIEVQVMRRGDLAATLNSSQAAYSALMKQSILPVPKNLPQPVKRTVMLPKGPSVMIGAARGVDAAIDKWTTQMVMRELKDRTEAEEEDLEMASAIAASAAMTSARVSTRVRQRTMTKKKVRGRVRIHGYSRRNGKIRKDFKRKSPRRVRGTGD